MLKIGRINISDKKSNKEVEILRKYYENMPNSWMGNEALGRIFRLMEEPSAHNYLKRAIEIRLPPVQKNGNQGWELIAIGNYYRMIGDLESANRYFQDAYVDLKGKVGNTDFPATINFLEMQHLIKACFLLKRYEEVTMYGELFQKQSPSLKLTANQLTTLAQAKLNNDTAIVENWLTAQEQWISSNAGKGKFSHTGGVNRLDIYEVALELLLEME